MKKRKRENTDDHPWLQPQKKIKTCTSLWNYIELKEHQYTVYDRFISCPISFTTKVQDTRDPIHLDETNTFNTHHLWETLCQMAFEIPFWNHSLDDDTVARLTDEACDLVIFLVKAASFVRGSTSWDAWNTWGEFLSSYMMETMLLFQMYPQHCLDMIACIDQRLFGCTNTCLQIYMKANVNRDFVRERNCGAYFPAQFYGPFPNFKKLTTMKQ